MAVEITDITDEDVAADSEPAASTEPKKPAATGAQLIQDAEAAMAKVANTLSKGDPDDPEYPKALLTVIDSCVTTSGWARPPFESLWKGIESSPGHKHIHTRMRWSAFKHRTGSDAFDMFSSKMPPPFVLLQQAALGIAGAAAEPNKRPDFASPYVLADLLEEVFQCVADEKIVSKYMPIQAQYGMQIKKLQFAIMRMLCVLYRELLNGDRIMNIKYVFRHAEAAGIMIVLANQSYVGHMEHAWNSVLKITLGIMHITQDVWEHAYQSARHGAAASAQAGHDFAFVPAAYDLIFFMCVGMPGSSFAIEEIRSLLQDIEKAEKRLEVTKMKDKVLFHCTTKRYLRALKAEWEKAEKAKADAKKAAGKSKKKAGKGKGKEGDNDKEAEAPQEMNLKPGHIPATDWRVFDQRFLGYYVWLEPPLQPTALKCENCGIQCIKVHRCDTCKLKGYCSSMCAAAHMFDHDCYEAPKPWLSPPTGPKQTPPTELGEEGLFGFIPWNWVRYGLLVLTSYTLYHLLNAFVDFREYRGLSNFEAVLKLHDLLWHAINNYLQERFGLGKPGAATEAIVNTPEVDPFVAEEEAFEKTLENLASGAAGIDDSDYVLSGEQAHIEL